MVLVKPPSMKMISLQEPESASLTETLGVISTLKIVRREQETHWKYATLASGKMNCIFSHLTQAERNLESFWCL